MPATSCGRAGASRDDLTCAPGRDNISRILYASWIEPRPVTSLPGRRRQGRTDQEPARSCNLERNPLRPSRTHALSTCHYQPAGGQACIDLLLHAERYDALLLASLSSRAVRQASIPKGPHALGNLSRLSIWSSSSRGPGRSVDRPEPAGNIPAADADSANNAVWCRTDHDHDGPSWRERDLHPNGACPGRWHSRLARSCLGRFADTGSFLIRIPSRYHGSRDRVPDDVCSAACHVEKMIDAENQQQAGLWKTECR